MRRRLLRLFLSALLFAFVTGCAPFGGYKPVTADPPSTQDPPTTVRPDTQAPPSYPQERK